MCKRNNDALFFTCSLIEQLGRSLHMRRGKVAAKLGEAGIQTLYRNADILHCEPIEKVADDVITNPETGGTNRLHISGGKVWVTDASCPDKICVRHGPTDQTADPIVCLPHTLVVQVLAPAGGTEALDGVSS